MRYLWLMLLVVSGVAKDKILREGRVVAASPALVRTEWPKEQWYWISQERLATGDALANVCATDVPKVGTTFVGGRSTWNKAKHCWQLRLRAR